MFQKRKRRQWIKRIIAGAAAVVMLLGSVAVDGLVVQAEEATVTEISSFTSHIPSELTLNKTNSDNQVLLHSFNAADEFVFGADVTFTDPEDQQSAALIFGIKENKMDDNHAMKANVHNKIDWNVPARVWGYGTDELKCLGENGSANDFFSENNIDVTKTFRMEVSVQKNDQSEYVLTYSLTNTNNNKVKVATGTLKDGYTGGRFGLMTYSSTAKFSNITVDGQNYGELESIEGGTKIHGVNGDAHAVSGVEMEEGKGFTYETDIDLAADSVSAALTFGIKDSANPSTEWIGANFNLNDKNARVFKAGSNDSVDIASANLEEKLDADKIIHAKLHVSAEKLVTFELYNTDNAEQKVTVTGNLGEKYTGGYLGLLTFDSSATFSNTTYTFDSTGDGSGGDAGEDNDENPTQAEGLIDFTNVGEAIMTVDKTAKTVTLANSGDHFAMYNGLTSLSNAFSFEADVKFNGVGTDNQNSAALVFGVADKNNPSGKWYAANVDTRKQNSDRLFRVFGNGNDSWAGSTQDMNSSIDSGRPLHLKLDMTADGSFTYTFSNVGAEEASIKSVTGTITDWNGGYVGLLSFASEAVFSNVKFTDNTVRVEESSYKTNLGTLSYQGGAGSWRITEDGLYSDATGQGDCFAFSNVKGTNFVYSTDIDFDGSEGAAALVFRSNNNLDSKECYAVNIDVGAHKCKFWRWQENDALQLIDEKEIAATEDEKYALKVVAYDSWILYYVNDELIASTGDYVLQPGNKGQNTVLKEGYFGLLNWNSKVTFQNTYYKAFDETFNPLLTDINVTSSTGTMEKETQFVPTEPITLQYVKNDAETVNINVTKTSEIATVVIKDANGTTYENGQGIPVAEGSNYITVESTVMLDDDTLPENARIAKMTYRVNVHRFKADDIYYNEAYRDQYHYSVKEGWANDPNGLVYYNGTYHMFYQFYDDIKWGPMHWAHATSKDLIHWEEKPIALYPDANGAMFSGCIVADTTNTSGFFDEGDPDGGLVALITADGNGQRIKLAYSKDEGKTWTKVDEIAADWTDDPLKDSAFRDPKVFRWEGKWFMVVAGGPLRIYSSTDLRTWKCEATYKDLHTECPDLYPIQDSEGNIKWVLSRGGRFYKVGDFKQVNENWTFVPDEEYKDSDGVMNFGHDFYAAMTYYVQDFGTKTNPKLPELIELNWMNTWEGDKCNLVAEKVGQDFNGTFNLNLKLGLIKEGDKYVLTQTPIDAYEDLRQTAVIDKTDITVDENNIILKDFVGDSYEIVAKFYPADGTRKVGFKVRTGENEETVVAYDLETGKMYIDRSDSGIIVHNTFNNVDAQSLTRNTDGSVDMRIFVDRASVEAFVKGCTVVGSNQIFPSPTSQGAEVFVQGTAAKADITIYQLESIWTGKSEVTTPQSIGTSVPANQTIYVGDSVKLSAYVLPTTVSQKINWSISSGNDVVSVAEDGTVTALKTGTAKIVASSVAKPELTKEFTIKVNENNFQTNIPEFVSVNGNWAIDGKTLSVSNTSQNDYYLSADKIAGDFVMETKIKYTNGLINLFIASEEQNPHNGAGAYAIQFGGGTTVRLFPFGKDDIATGTLSNAINDEAYHTVKIVKEGMKLAIYVDKAKCLEHTFTNVENFFSNGHVGLGLWDGALDVQTFYVHELLGDSGNSSVMYLEHGQVGEADAITLERLMETTYQSKFAGMSTYFVEVELLEVNVGTGETEEVHNVARTFILPYPDEIDAANYQNYDFVVLHLKTDGTNVTPELVECTPTEAGLQITSTLSPFAIGYKEKITVPPSGGNAGTTGNAGTSTGTAGKQETDNKKPTEIHHADSSTGKTVTATGVSTGDSANTALWMTVAVVAVAAIAGIVFYKKKQKMQ